MVTLDSYVAEIHIANSDLEKIKGIFSEILKGMDFEVLKSDRPNLLKFVKGKKPLSYLGIIPGLRFFRPFQRIGVTIEITKVKNAFQAEFEATPYMAFIKQDSLDKGISLYRNYFERRFLKEVMEDFLAKLGQSGLKVKIDKEQIY